MGIWFRSGITLALLLWISASAWAVGLFLMEDPDQTAPSFQFRTFEGEVVSSRELRGKVLVLNFWMSTCKPCMKEMPELETYYDQYRDEPRLAFYVVNSGFEPLEKAKACVEKKWYQISDGDYRYDLPFAYDENNETFKSFRLRAHPSLVIIDQQHRVRLKHTGAIDRLPKQLSRLTDQLLAQP